ncbi:MAG: F0F1 ATP synthase subunit epsilon [Gammaproteobacteria bacterium]
MHSFDLVLQDATHAENFNNISSFVGEDSSGSFGVLANHDRFMTSLVMGLSRFRMGNNDWQYIATPGAIVYFHNNQLLLLTRHFLIDTDYMRISDALEQQLLDEEIRLSAQKKSLRRMEEEVLKRLWELSRNQS